MESDWIGKMNFLPAKVTDAPAIAALVNSAYRGDTSRKGWTTEADFLDGQRTDQETICNFIESPGRVMLINESANPQVCVQLEKRDSLAYLGMLTVSPLLQGKGMGSKILEAAENFAQTVWGSTLIEITVISLRIELLEFYRRRGYRDFGKRSPFPNDNPRFGILKVPNLTFVHMQKDLLVRSAE
jgi:GNAT superfamily N-acetyltransferase